MTTSLPVLFARHRANDPVLVEPGRTLTRGELGGRVEAVASTLPRSQGDVLVACEDRVAFAVAVLAAWRAGLGVALPPNLRPATLDAVRAASSVVASIDDAGVLEAGGDDHRRAVEASWLPPMIPSRHLATIYTSGTTGSHRPVTKTAAQLLGEAGVLVETFELDHRSRVLATVPPHHIYGLLFGLLLPFVSGGVVIARAPLHPPAIAAAATEHQANILVSTPAHLRGLVVLEPDGLPSFERVFSSGAPLHPRTATMLAERFRLRVIEVLGSTETGGIGWRVADDGPERAWQPLPGIGVRADEEGRMLLTSPFLPSHLAQPWPADDRIEMDGALGFWHRGRIDDVVKIGGKRVSPRAVEARLLEHPAVLDAAVLVAEGQGDEQPRLKAVVVAPDADVESLRQSLLQWFDPVALPRPLRRVAAIPREESGKIVRERLLSLLERVDTEIDETRGIDLQSVPTADPTDEARRFAVVVAADSPLFEGHFPDEPVLPGVAQLDAVVFAAVRRAWPALGGIREVRRLKFKATIAPGDRLDLELCREGGEVTFELRRGSVVCAEGALSFGEPE